MKKGIRKTIAIIAVLTMTFQMGMPMLPGLTSKVFATNTTIPVVAENLEEKFKTGEVTQNNQSSEQIDPQEVGTSEKVVIELSESTDTEQTEEISRNYEIKDEETWDVSANGDGSVIAKWTLDDRTLTISGTGEMKVWDYDSEEDWHDTQYTNLIQKVIIEEGITRIGDYAFLRCSSLTSINIPESVTSIGEDAFSRCSSLTSITIPEGVTSIGDYAFSGCSSLTSINIPESVTSIGDWAFRECSSLESIEISESVTNIGDNAFNGCSSLTSINIPESVTSIGSGTFSGCSSLTSINIPESVTSIGRYAFNGCSSLTSINIPDGVTSIGWYAFSGCSSLTSINIPESVTSIGDSAFNGCSSLTSINIPESVTNIGHGAFFGCSSLTSINIPESVTSIGEDAFRRCSSLEGIHVDENNTEYISENGILFNKEKTEIICYPAGKKDIKEYKIPESVTNIGDSAFSGCSSLTSINIPESVTSIGDFAFSGCSSLTSINIPESVTSIGSYAFEECSSLTSINIPESVTSIGISIFEGCSSLTRINIPESVTSIGSYAFYGCSSLTSINIPESVTNIGDWAFEGCSSLISINIPESVTNIGDWAFEGCSSLTSINIPESVTSIGYGAFGECDSLVIYVKADTEGHRYVEENKKGYILEGEAINIDTTYRIQEEETWDISTNQDGSVIAKWTLSDRTLTISGTGEMKDWGWSSVEDWHDTQYTTLIQKVIIEEGITSIGSDAFYECSSLTSINIPESVTSIGISIFEGCSSLTSINIPESVTNIEDRTFAYCDSLESINIPESVTSIDSYAFYECSSLTSINIPESVTSIGSSAFCRCSSLTSINIPENVISIGRYAFNGCSSLEGIHVDENNTEYISENGILFNKEKTEIICYPAEKKDIKEYKIPENVTSIEDSAFSGCSSLTSINIPENVTSIGRYAFDGCSSLESINIPESVTSIGNYAFRACDSLVIYVKTDTEAHRYAEENEQWYIIDDIAPTITFTPNAGQNAQKEYRVEVDVLDNFEEVGINENSLKYQWTQSETQPTKESFTESFENGQAIIKNTGDGAWYLWIYAEDNVGNETIIRSEAFHFDNTAPNVNVEYSTKNPTKENVTVTITSNEEVQAIQGWTLSSDKKTLTKEYSENTTETITIKDLVGNETKVDIEINNIIIIGDINQDGRIDITDFLMLKRHLVAGNKTDWILTGSSLEAADMNENGIVDITDMLMLKRAVVENM